MPKTSGSALRAVWFTDIVGSTELAREMGDVRWTRLLAAHHLLVREQLRAHRGREVDTAGDGFFAVFESPTEAVRCAFAATRAVQEIGLDIRAGIHFGEVETDGTNVSGLVVHTGARVMSQGGAAQVVITQTVKDLVAGARLQLQERDTVALKGVPGTWTLYDVIGSDDELRPHPIEQASVATERRDRASAGVPRRRRARWLVPAALVSVAALAIAGTLVLRSDEVFLPQAGTVTRVDGDRFDRPIDVGGSPVALAETEGRIWVVDQSSQVYWVNEQDGSAGSSGTDGIPTGVSAGAGALWITAGFGNGPDATVGKLDPDTGRTAPAFQTPVGSQAITFGGGAVWVANPDTGSITRFEPVGNLAMTIPLPRSQDPPWPDSIAFGSLGGDAVWVGDALRASVYRVDGAAPYDVTTFGVGAPVSGLAMGADTVWVASSDADAVYALDPSTGRLRTTVDVAAQGCNGPASIAVNADGVWVACGLSQRVIRIDPASGTVTGSLAVEGEPAALALAQDGSIWVAVQPR